MRKERFFYSGQFIAIIAAMMGLTAISIDAVLPAFPAMSADFGLAPARANDIHQVVFVYMLGFASSQILFGILSDALGRKMMLTVGIGIYVLASAWILFIESFPLLLLARFLQGVGLAAPRVLSLAVVRDVTVGRRMSQIMSYALMVFMAVPVIAPSLGQFVLGFGHWHAIFLLFVAAGVAVMAWILLALPETLPVQKRTPLRLKSIKSALLTCLTHRPTLLYVVMLGLVFAMVMTYISQAEQIFQRDVYHLGDKFPLFFALVCTGQITASYTNSRLVLRVGMHKIVKVSLRLMMVNALLALLVVGFSAGKPPLGFFLLFLIAHFYLYSLALPNLNSLSLEPHAQIVGVASALVGSGMTVIGVGVANVISSQFNGTLYPLTAGFAFISLLLIVLNRYVNRISGDEA